MIQQAAPAAAQASSWIPLIVTILIAIFGSLFTIIGTLLVVLAKQVVNRVERVEKSIETTNTEVKGVNDKITQYERHAHATYKQKADCHSKDSKACKKEVDVILQTVQTLLLPLKEVLSFLTPETLAEVKKTKVARG